MLLGSLLVAYSVYRTVVTYNVEDLRVLLASRPVWVGPSAERRGLKITYLAILYLQPAADHRASSIITVGAASTQAKRLL